MWFVENSKITHTSRTTHKRISSAIARIKKTDRKTGAVVATGYSRGATRRDTTRLQRSVVKAVDHAKVKVKIEKNCDTFAVDEYYCKFQHVTKPGAKKPPPEEVICIDDEQGATTSSEKNKGHKKMTDTTLTQLFGAKDTTVSF